MKEQNKPGMQQSYPMTILSIWKKIKLLKNINKECTMIYPATLNHVYASQLKEATNDIAKCLTTGYEKHRINHTIELLLEKSSRLKLMWKDGYRRGLAPCIEKEIVIEIINALQKELRIIMTLTGQERVSSNAEKREPSPSLNPIMQSNWQSAS